VFRQSDEVFVQILNDLREGRGQNALNMLQQRCMRPLPCVNDIRPTELYARNADVDSVNSVELNKLADAELREFRANDAVASAIAMKLELDGEAPDRSADQRIRQQQARSFSSAHPLSPVTRCAHSWVHAAHFLHAHTTHTSCAQETLERHEFFRDCMAAPTVSLKLGAQVMLLRNLELSGGASKMLVNGSRGVISDFAKAEDVKVEMRKQITAVRACLRQRGCLLACAY
jgi:hypothetical protein